MRTSMLLVFFSLLAAFPLNAGVVERDFLTPGDGLLTYDDVNRREWLDLTYTSGTYLSMIKAAMAPREFLEDFSFATLEDIQQLALSAEVNWLDNLGTSNSIDPNLLPRSQEVPSPGDQVGTSNLEAKNLIDLLGKVIVYQVTYRNVFTDNDFTQTTSFSSGQVAQAFVDEEPLFDGTNVSVYFFDTPGPNGVRFANGTYGEDHGFITTELLFEFPQASGDTGPFWLYRNAIPEPTSIALLTIATLTALSTRTRHR